jgi:hypothetical protein
MLGLIVEVTSLYYGHTLSWFDLLDVFHHSLCHLVCMPVCVGVLYREARHEGEQRQITARGWVSHRSGDVQ